MFANWPVGSNNSSSIKPSGKASKAASVGANTVNGPSPLKSSASSAAITAASKVLWLSEPTIISTTVVGLDGLTIIIPTIPFSAWLPTEQS